MLFLGVLSNPIDCHSRRGRSGSDDTDPVVYAMRTGSTGILKHRVVSTLRTVNEDHNETDGSSVGSGSTYFSARDRLLDVPSSDEEDSGFGW